MNIDLTGQRAIVCGASKGIGRATAHELATLGAQITLIARNQATLESVLETLPGAGHHIVVADYADPAALQVKIEAYLNANAADATSSPVRILVNNTGGPPAGPVCDATLQQFQSAFTQNLLCNQVMAQAVLPAMKAAHYGRIINVISTSVKAPIAGLGVSNTIRAAVATWAKTLATEVAQYGITVNNVLPGATDTDRLAEIFAHRATLQDRPIAEIIEHEKSSIPARRFAQPGELAAAIAFLASPAAAYITGINLPVDGGRTPSL